VSVTTPTELKPAPVIVPSVLVIGDRTRCYRPAPIQRLEIDSETAHQLRLKGREKGQTKGRNVWQDKAYCIPSDQEWFEVMRRHDWFEDALDELGTCLLRLGSYAKNLAAAGGFKKAPNPLTTTVIRCQDPETDDRSRGLNLPWEVYPRQVYRFTQVAHTPKMLRYWLEGEHWSGESITSQDDTFICPDDATWEQFQAFRAAAISASNHLQDYLKQLGTYQEAKQDGRYHPNGRAHPNRVDEPATAETTHVGGVAAAVEPSATNGSVSTPAQPDPEFANPADKRSLPAAPITLKVGDFVELYRSEDGQALPEAQRRRAEVVEFFGKDLLRVRYRGETFADKRDSVQQFRKLPDREPLPYPTLPVKLASRGEEVVVTAPDNPHYGESFTVDVVSIFGVYRADGTFFYDEELGYRVDDPYIQPIPAERDPAFTVALERGDLVQVMADDDLYEAFVVVNAILPSFEIEVDYQGALFDYSRQSLCLYERATPESLAYLQMQHEPAPSTAPVTPTLHDRRQQLIAEIEAVQQSGPVAPTGAEWKRDRKTKTIGKGDRAKTVTYPANGDYYYTISHRDAILNNAKGKLVKALHVGISDSDAYKDWQQRFERRRTLKRLQDSLRQLERSLQA